MTFNQELFQKTIIALREQYDKDKETAKKLTEIYGADVNPNDNSLLTNLIFELLQKQFPTTDGFCDIQTFCFDQDFGRKLVAVRDPIDLLWKNLIGNIDVDLEE